MSSNEPHVTRRRLNQIAIALLAFPNVILKAQAHPGYRIEKMPKPADVPKMFPEDRTDLVQILNRCDLEHLPRQRMIVLPSDWSLDLSAYSPWPLQLNWNPVPPKALFVHLPSQLFAAYEGGNVARWGPVSSGRAASPTPAGNYHLNWRSRSRRSTEDPAWLLEWYFNFDNSRGLSFHQYALPGSAASHGCIRLLEDDAKWIYGWGESWKLDDKRKLLSSGTPVRLIGQFDYKKQPLWLSLQWLAQPDIPLVP